MNPSYNLYTPLDVIEYISRSQGLNFKIENTKIQLDHFILDTSYLGLQNGALDLIAHLVKKGLEQVNKETK